MGFLTIDHANYVQVNVMVDDLNLIPFLTKFSRYLLNANPVFRKNGTNVYCI